MVKVNLQSPLPVPGATFPVQVSFVLAVRVTAPVGLYELTLKSRTVEAVPALLNVIVGLELVIVVEVLAWFTCRDTDADAAV